MKFVKLICLVLLSSHLFNAHIKGQTDKSWESIGPEGCAINLLVQDPNYKNTLYAITNTNPAGIYKSTDLGNSWDAISNIYLGEGGIDIRNFEIDSSNSSVIYTAPYRMYPNPQSIKIFKSINGGQNWNELNIPIDSTKSAFVGGIKVDPQDPATIHVICSMSNKFNTVNRTVHFKTTDNGINWSSNTMMEVDSVWPYLNCLEIDPMDSNLLYAGGRTNHYGIIYKSNDGGITWSDTCLVDDLCYVRDIVIDSQTEGKVYACSSGRVYRSTNYGETWIRLNDDLYGHRLTIDPNDTNFIYVGGLRSVMKYDINQDLIQPLTNISYGTFCTSLLITEDGATDIIFFTNESGIYKSLNDGNSWQTSNSGISATIIEALKCAPSMPTLMYIAIESEDMHKISFLYSSLEQKISKKVEWQAKDIFFETNNIINNYSENAPCANNCCGKIESPTINSEWENIGLNDGIFRIAVSPTDPNIIYALQHI